MKTTLDQIKSHTPCEEGWETLTAYLGPDFPMDREFPVSEIVKSNGVSHTFWLLRRIVPTEQLKPIAVKFACDCAERVLPIYEAQHPENKAPRKAIEAARAWLANPCADAADATYAAATAASHAADAAAAASHAAYAAAIYAADAAAAARAAYATEREWQKGRLIELLEGLVLQTHLAPEDFYKTDDLLIKELKQL